MGDCPHSQKSTPVKTTAKCDTVTRDMEKKEGTCLSEQEMGECAGKL